MGKMRKAEKQEVLKKITKYYQKKIEELVNNEQWTFSEVCEQVGVNQSRLTEIRVFQNEGYGRPLNERLLKQSVAGGIITVNEIIENLEITPKQAQYIVELTMFDDPLTIHEGKLLIERKKQNPKERSVGEVLRDYRLGVLVEKKKPRKKDTVHLS